MRPSREPVEKVFFEDVYRRTRPKVLAVAPPRLDLFALDVVGRLEPLAGKRVLDLGAGEGDLSIELARRGGEVTAVDLARQGLDHARSRALAWGARAQFVCASAHELPFPDGSFDRVAGNLILHHLELDLAAAEVRRVLSPAGWAVFSENLYTNPLLYLAREYLVGRFGIRRLGTPTERPLSFRSFALLGRLFRRVSFSYPSFLFFHLLDRQVFGYRHRGVNRLMIELDRIVHRHLPFLRFLTFRANLILEP